MKQFPDAILNKCIKYIRYVYMYVDVLMLTIAFFLSAILVYDIKWAFSETYISVGIFLSFLWIFITYTKTLYKEILMQDAEIVIKNTLKIWAFFTAASALLYIILLQRAVSAQRFYLLFVLTMAMYGAFLMLNRIAFLSFRKTFKDKIKRKKNIVIIGCNPYSKLLQEYISNGYCDFNVVGYFNDQETKLIHDNHLVKGSTAESLHYISDETDLDEIFCTLSSFNKEELQKLMFEADKNMVRIKFLPDFYNLFNKPTRIDFLGKIPLITVREEPLLKDRNVIMKRIFDFVFSAMVIVLLLSWLMPVIILLIKIESKGPAFFRQQRSGKNGHSFTCYKFRSMYTNASAERQQASRGDKRVTPLGAFLRKTSLDELPQFFNVLIGNMSIVGPRPHMLLHTKEYSDKVDAYMIRHFVKPGITGWAQVNGYRGETKTFEAIQKRIEHDIWYLENWSFMLDLKIVFLTVWNIIRGEENAY